MLIVRERRNLLKSKKSAVLSINQVNDLINEMAIELRPTAVTRLREIAYLTKSVFCESHFIETFKGEAIRVANFNVYKKTIKFARKFFNEKSKKYVLETKDLSENETVLEISFKGISILKIKFSCSSHIEFEFLKNKTSYEDLFKHYQDRMQLSGEFDKIKEAQDKLQSIVQFGPEAIEEVSCFFEEYIKDFSINLDLKHTWYKIKLHDLKKF